MSEPRLVTLEVSDGVATVTMRRADRLNGLVDEMLEDLLGCLEAAADDPDVRVVVLCGEGRAFCAGGDLRAGVGGGVGGDGSVVEAAGNLRRYMRTAQLLHDMPKPTVASVHGACAGAGLSLACAADVRIAAESAVFATAFVNVGLSGDFGGTWTLTHILGTARARAAYLLGDRIAAAEAREIGLVSAVVADEELGSHVAEVAARLARAAPLAMRAAKANVNDALHLSFSAALDREAERHIRTSRTADAREATAAFLEKRTPVYRGQ